LFSDLFLATCVCYSWLHVFVKFGYFWLYFEWNLATQFLEIWQQCNQSNAV